MYFHRFCLAAVLNLLALAGMSQAASISVSLDRWMYPFAFGGGTRDLAPTFGAVGDEGFDNRDGQFLLGFDTSADILSGQGADRYQIHSLTVRAMVGAPSGFTYDPTYDPFRSYLPASDPRFVDDSDPGRPIELHGVGFRNEYTELGFGASDNQPPLFEENAPFGPVGAGTRNTFPLGFLSPGVASDVSNNVADGLESQPWAIATTDLPSGDVVTNNTTFSFNVDLSNADVLDYLQRGLNSGVLGFTITSMHAAAQAGGPPVPQFVTKENTRAGSIPAVLDIDYEILPELSPERVWVVDSDGQASAGMNWDGGVAPTTAGDSAAFLNAITMNRTVQIDAPLTLEGLRFDDDNNYTLAGPQAITLAGAGDEGTKVLVENTHGNGQHTISGALVVADALSIVQQSEQPLVIGGLLDNSAGHAIGKTGAGPLVVSGVQNHGANATLSVDEGVVVMNTDAASGGARNLSVVTSSDLHFGSTQHLAGLSISAGGAVRLTPGDSKNLVTGALSLAGDAAPTGVLDITDNALVLDFAETGPNPGALIRQQILAGRGGPGFGATWAGQGITSSTAEAAVIAEPESVSVGYAVNGELPLGAYVTFRNVAVDESSLLVRYTRTGDANLDGMVNDEDVTILGAFYAPGVANATWAMGDFDYNGFVDDGDVTLLGAVYDPAAAPLGVPADTAATVAAIPEPRSMLLCAIALLVLAVAAFRASACERREHHA